MQQINFTGNLEQQTTIFFIIGEAKKTVLEINQHNTLNLKLSNSLNLIN